ncbi:hypothetical protein AB0G54_30215 [Streptomyces yokosukanensis]|uniref:hypothetical protein n=1 Tax=Streptomyces yokosukanensis TaxID=67386 RepID=UPI000D167E24|nr:hypothetical protein [Streptomyces yokosukanensis]
MEDDLPTVSVRAGWVTGTESRSVGLWRADAIVLFDWLMTAQKQALADLLSRLEWAADADVTGAGGHPPRRGPVGSAGTRHRGVLRAGSRSVRGIKSGEDHGARAAHHAEVRTVDRRQALSTGRYRRVRRS